MASPSRVMDAIDYDFSSIKRILAFGVLEGTMRGYDLVTETRRYLAAHPYAVVVNMGTYRKFYGLRGDLKRSYLRQIRRKLI